MIEILISASVTVAGYFIAGRLAYGSWPWEVSKSWYCTSNEIMYLRAVVEAHHLAAMRRKEKEHRQ